jgi:hypothetical protein
MNSYYECKRCFYKCYQRNDMLKHLNRKKICIRTIDSYNYQDNDLYNTSLIRVNKNKNINMINNFEDYENKYKSGYQNIIIRSFDEDWDDTKMDEKTKIMVVLADTKYTKTLEFLLENNVNLNVLIDYTGNTGLVYKNNNFEIISIKDIVKKSMAKIYHLLHKFCQDIEFNNIHNIKWAYLEEEKKMIENKYNEYISNRDIEEKVIHFMKDIYHKKRGDTIKLCNNIIINKNSETGF